MRRWFFVFEANKVEVRIWEIQILGQAVSSRTARSDHLFNRSLACGARDARVPVLGEAPVVFVRRGRILHVDDRVQVRRVLVDFLLDHGWNLCIESYFAPERLNV